MESKGRLGSLKILQAVALEEQALPSRLYRKENLKREEPILVSAQRHGPLVIQGPRYLKAVTNPSNRTRKQVSGQRRALPASGAHWEHQD